MRTWILLTESGSKAIEFTSLLAMELKGQGEAASVPVEEGSFANYNKVQSPNEIQLSLGISGDNSTLEHVLTTIEELQKGTELLSFSTPSAFYESLTMESYSYKHERGRGVLVVDLTLVEVRQVATQTSTTNYTLPKCKNPSSVSTVNRGRVHTIDVPTEDGYGSLALNLAKALNRRFGQSNETTSTGN